jgi:hypothetical protein
MRLCLVSLALLLCAATPAAAGGCVGVNSHSGKRQSVQETYRTGISHPRRFFAESTHDRASGRPQIIYYRRYSSAPAYFKTFVRPTNVATRAVIATRSPPIVAPCGGCICRELV